MMSQNIPVDSIGKNVLVFNSKSNGKPLSPQSGSSAMSINSKVSERLENLVITENHRKWGSEIKSGYAPGFREAAVTEDPAALGPLDMMILKMGNMERIILSLKREEEARALATNRSLKRGLMLAVVVAIAGSALIPRVQLFSSESSTQPTTSLETVFAFPPTMH